MRKLLLAFLLFAWCAAAQETSPALADGVTLAVRLEHHLDTSKARPGDEVRAILLTPVLQNGKIAVPMNAKILGRVLAAEPFASMRESRLVIRFDEGRWRGSSVALRAFIVRHLALKSTVYTPDDRSMCPPISRFVDSRQTSAGSGTSQQSTPPQNTQPTPPPPPPVVVAPPSRPDSYFDRCSSIDKPRHAQEKVTFTSPPLAGIEIRRASNGATELVSSTRTIFLKRGTMFELRNVR